MEMSDIEEQHLACQVRWIFKNKRVTEIEIQKRKQTEKDEIAPTVSEISCGESSCTETVREQCCDVENYPGHTPEDHIEYSIHQRVIEIMHERTKGDIPILPEI